MFILLTFTLYTHADLAARSLSPHFTTSLCNEIIIDKYDFIIENSTFSPSKFCTVAVVNVLL